MLYYHPVRCRLFACHGCRLPPQSARLHSLPNTNVLPIQPSASSTRHHDLPTFFDHASSTSLSPASTVFVGTSYEYLCARTLLRLGFTDLIRSGGRSDRGIDLFGYWALPFQRGTFGSHEFPFRAVVQCKATARKAGPDIIRELEGALAGAPGEWRSDGTAAVLCTKREATIGVREAVRRSEKRIIWALIEDSEEMKGSERVVEDVAGLANGHNGDKPVAKAGRVKQILWNDRVAKMLGRGLGTGLRYTPGDSGIEREICLTWEGRLWEPDLQGDFDWG